MDTDWRIERMEPISAGAIALVALVSQRSRVENEAIEGLLTRIVELLRTDSPQTAAVLERVIQDPELVRRDPEVYGDELLVTHVEEAAAISDRVATSLKQLTQIVNSEGNPEIQKQIHTLATAIANTLAFEQE